MIHLKISATGESEESVEEDLVSEAGRVGRRLSKDMAYVDWRCVEFLQLSRQRSFVSKLGRVSLFRC